MYSASIHCMLINRNIVNLTLIQYSRCIKSWCNVVYQQVLNETRPEEFSKNVQKLLEKHQDNILYSTYIEDKKLKLSYRSKVPVFQKQYEQEKRKLRVQQCIEPLPFTMKYLTEHVGTSHQHREDESNNDIGIHFPYKNSDISVFHSNDNNYKTLLDVDDDDVATITDVEIRTRLKVLNESRVNWMTDYENYNDIDTVDDNWKGNYGTPDPNTSISNVPCGGCGALLHCKDTAIPGYIPSEIFKNYYRHGGIDLKQIICQRCYFLKTYNCALQVRVAPDDYPQVLRIIMEKKALVILMVDLLDFPCSIWPGIADLLGQGRSIFIVGNKVDLLPQDGKGFLERVAHALENSVLEAGFATADIKGVALISAKTGFGIEDLITKLFDCWRYKGDVFLVGCTNVGKSSLFNALLQSDYCKSQVSDLIQRATTSLWPGTTLNLLKFPIMRPQGWKLHLRNKRLMKTRQLMSQEYKLRKSQLFKTRDTVRYATLLGHIDKTFTAEESAMATSDPFSLKGSQHSAAIGKFGIDDDDKDHVLSKWCYDTPGVVQQDQIIHLLTTDELMLTLPKELIIPHTFKLRPGSTIFIGGLGRLDYLEGTDFVKFTVFRSSGLPITVCSSDKANELYEDFLGTDIFSVPISNANRLKLWPGLHQASDFNVKGIDWEYSCADVLLSNAGWIAVTCGPDLECKLRAWTPEKRGVHLRDSLLPKSVSLRGKKIRYCPAYKTNRFYVN